eukprot:1194842-Prorocentrum_minimum.AAC.3
MRKRKAAVDDLHQRCRAAEVRLHAEGPECRGGVHKGSFRVNLKGSISCRCAKGRAAAGGTVAARLTYSQRPASMARTAKVLGRPKGWLRAP